jgi:multicomponent Na+:H+ antiporter subunit E
MKPENPVCRTDSRASSDTGDAPGHFTGLKAGPVDLVMTFFFRWLVFAILWWGLSAGKISQVLLVIFIITISAALSSLLVPPQKIRIPGILKFIPFFVRLSLLGGLDVASRAFKPSMPLKTGFINYNLGLTHPTARVIFVWVVSLLPGTASVRLTEQGLRVHVLDRDLAHTRNLENLEQNVADLFRDPRPTG